MGNVIKGYKAFNKDLTCLDFQYEIGKSYEMPEEELKICKKGFHFCTDIDTCFNYYSLSPFDVRIAEVEAYGKVLYGTKETGKCCTNKIRIVKEIPWTDAIKIAATQDSSKLKWQAEENFGLNNCGYCNYGRSQQGYSNLGKYNTGWDNIGEWNNGSFNLGKRNEGDCNIGTDNLGAYNRGKENTGSHNLGSYNLGLLNKGNNIIGILCTTPNYITLFNKPTKMTLESFLKSDGYLQLSHLLQYSYTSKNITDCCENVNTVIKYDINDLVKREIPVSDRGTTMRMRYYWDYYMKDFQKEAIFELPNFDPKIFKEITSIDITDDYKEYLSKRN